MLHAIAALPGSHPAKINRGRPNRIVTLLNFWFLAIFSQLSIIHIHATIRSDINGVGSTKKQSLNKTEDAASMARWLVVVHKEIFYCLGLRPIHSPTYGRNSEKQLCSALIAFFFLVHSLIFLCQREHSDHKHTISFAQFCLLCVYVCGWRSVPNLFSTHSEYCRREWLAGWLLKGQRHRLNPCHLSDQYSSIGNAHRFAMDRQFIFAIYRWRARVSKTISLSK